MIAPKGSISAKLSFNTQHARLYAAASRRKTLSLGIKREHHAESNQQLAREERWINACSKPVDWRKCAEKERALADSASDPDAKSMMLGIVKFFEKLAEAAEDRAHERA
jgi:hypothetical protein